MAESFENLDTILRGWAIDSVQKEIEQVREAERRKVQLFLVEKASEKILEQSQSAVEQD